MHRVIKYCLVLFYKLGLCNPLQLFKVEALLLFNNSSYKWPKAAIPEFWRSVHSVPLLEVFLDFTTPI